MHGGTLQPQASGIGEEIPSLPSVTASLLGPLGELSSAMDEEQAPFEGRAPSLIRDLLHGLSRGANTQLITRDTITGPIIASQARMRRGVDNVMPAVPARLTASDLERHMRESSHNLSRIPSRSSSQSSRSTDVMEEDNADYTHRTI